MCLGCVTFPIVQIRILTMNNFCIGTPRFFFFFFCLQIMCWLCRKRVVQSMLLLDVLWITISIYLIHTDRDFLEAFFFYFRHVSLITWIFQSAELWLASYSMTSSTISSGALVTLKELSSTSPHFKEGASLRVTGKWVHFTECHFNFLYC